MEPRKSARSVFGDLGRKVSPHRIDYSLRFSQPLDDRVIFDNGITNSGKIRINTNSDAALATTCLILEIALALTLHLLQMYLNEWCLFTKPASFDIGLMEIERPSFVVFEIAQRFLIGQLNYRKSIFEQIAEKIVALPIDRQGVIVRNLESQSFGPEQLIAAKTLVDTTNMLSKNILTH